MDKLKPCPFCNTTDIRYREDRDGLYLECHNCSCQSGRAENKSGLWHIWNSRFSHENWIKYPEIKPTESGEYMVYDVPDIYIGLYNADNDTWTNTRKTFNMEFVTHWREKPGVPK